jgi:hypothetical protein
MARMAMHDFVLKPYIRAIKTPGADTVDCKTEKTRQHYQIEVYSKY